MTPEVESARSDWEDAWRRLEEEAKDPRRGDALFLQLEVVSEELRKRIGATYTLRELASEYHRAEVWVRDVVAERAATPDWPRMLAVVEGAAFHVYSRGALDYVP
jgi:hypothetical protein